MITTSLSMSSSAHDPVELTPQSPLSNRVRNELRSIHLCLGSEVSLVHPRGNNEKRGSLRLAYGNRARLQM